MERRLTYFAGSQWISLPWESRTKSPFHTFLDTMTVLPNIIAEGYDLYSMLQLPTKTGTFGPSIILVKVLELTNCCWELDARLHFFYDEFEREYLDHLYWPELSAGIITTADEKELGMVFPVAFQFLNINIAHVCLLYWVSNAILWSGMAFMYNLIAGFPAQAVLKTPPEIDPRGSETGTSPTSINLNSLPLLEHRGDVASLAKNIC